MFKAVKTFKCKATKRIYHPGEEYDGKLAKEHQELGNVEEVESEEEPEE